MKTQRTLIAACIAALFASSAVMAKDRWEYHEDLWDDTRSYGKINIDQDSVKSWGPWEQFLEPEAGFTGVSFPGMGSGERYLPVPPLVDGGGAWRGYIVYSSHLYDEGGWNSYSEGYGGSFRNRPQAGLIELHPSPDDPSVVTVLTGAGPGRMTVKITPLAGSDPLLVLPELTKILGASPTNIPVQFGEGTTWVGIRDGLANFGGSHGGDINIPVIGESYDGGEGGWSVGIGGHNRIWARSGTSTQYDTTPYMTLGGYLYASVWGYIYGDGGEYYYNYISASDGAEGYVAGIATSPADMGALQAGKVTATYEGYTSGYKNTSGQSPVVVNVNFGNASWSGTWNNGSNGNVWYGTDSSGRPYLYGQVGLIASGTISGANFQSTAVSANDGNVTGNVQGTFYGPMAAGLGGIVNITKTPNVGVETVARTLTPSSPATYVDVFAAQKAVPR